jgi:hypothetical protein
MDDVRRAWEARDPALVDLVVALASETDEGSETPVREGAPTFTKYMQEVRSKSFRKKPLAEQAALRVERMRALEAPGAEVPLPERLRLHEVLDALWRDDGPFARSCLLAVIDRVRLAYGPWRALKRVFKEAESRGDTEVLGALTARIDSETTHSYDEVGSLTVAYLRRRAWRYLRRTAQARPACYADVAADVLAHYKEGTRWDQTWVARHILAQGAGGPEWGRHAVGLAWGQRPRPDALFKDRAFPELWRRSPRPLFALLERARCDLVRQFAAEALKADFRASLREVEPSWVARLVQAGSRPVDELIVWVLTNVPKFEQASFRSLGLHEAVLRLFESSAPEARDYAAGYARTHARDLPVNDLVRLVANDHPAVHRLAIDLLAERDPRKDVGLDVWGKLLDLRHGQKLASDALAKHFGARELTPEWFRDRLLSMTSHDGFDLVRGLLARTHPRERLGPAFYQELIERMDEAHRMTTRVVAEFALKELAGFDLNTLDAGFLRRLELRRLTTAVAGFDAWVEQGRLQPKVLGLDVLKALAYHPDWEANSWIADLKRSGRAWAKDLSFDEEQADRVLGWLKDVRRFNPADLGLDWLMGLVRRAEPRYHNFATDVLIKGFVPADFAPSAAADAVAGAALAGAAAVDFGGASFLFTGKMATMQRAEAERQVRQCNGAVASGVNAKLHYLVIGDEGSPLFGHGKKGNKQLKAEEVNMAGGNIKIVSETAFLKMLAGAPQGASRDASLAGCERLWQMATAGGPAEAPLSQFAIKYLKRHHPDIALAETDRPVDPGAEVPPEFLSFDRVEPLLAETRKPLRDFALELAGWEFARWSPTAEALVRLAESPHADVRRFVAKALLADDAPEHRRYRIDPGSLAPEAVYRFCESADAGARALGMELIRRAPRLQQPEELFRLTESPDRHVRAFVVRTLWSLYRDRGITEGWKPTEPPKTTVGAAARKAAAAAVSADGRGPGPPARPERLPAGLRELGWLLRRGLFELPPARPEKSDQEGASERVKPLPARQAKLALVEVMRDLALEQVDFARVVLPLLDEFLGSRGPSERAACLVAVTRIRHTHPSLRLDGGGARP